MGEDLVQRGHLGPGEGERRAVRDVEQVGAAGTQHPADEADVLDRAGVLGQHRAGEDVADDDVAAARLERRELGPRLADPEPEAVRAELGAHQLGHPGVGLDDQLARAGARRGDVAGQRAGAAAEVQRVERGAVGREQVEQVADQADVLELQVGRVLEVDVGLRDPLDVELPAAVAVGVLEQLGRTGVHRVAAGDRCGTTSGHHPNVTGESGV